MGSNGLAIGNVTRTALEAAPNEKGCPQESDGGGGATTLHTIEDARTILVPVIFLLAAPDAAGYRSGAQEAPEAPSGVSSSALYPVPSALIRDNR